nr:type IV pilin N-terminal domain-containing protein [uncultured Methanospirillum sp.]
MKEGKEKKSESAVSPVVGVLLMLVVTIIIAAVVSGFAGGLTEKKGKTPQVSMDATFGLTDSMGSPALTIKHLSGDPINTKNVQLITTWTNQSGVANVAKSIQANYTGIDAEFYPAEGYTCKYDINSLNHYYKSSSSGKYYYWHEPCLVINGLYANAENGPSIWWGNFTMKAGDAIQVTGGFVEGKELIKNLPYITSKDEMEVKLIDTTTGGTIYDKTIPVRE